MRIAVTGATGFLGRYIVNHLLREGHTCRCWYRPGSDRGGKEVHAGDVARAVAILLTAEGIAGQAYNCYDMYISDQRVAAIAKRLTGSPSTIAEMNKGPKNQIVTDKLRKLGMTFGGPALLEQTVTQLLAAGA
jgi:nucleoside-diphosphate-sugar epimerase